MKQPENGLSTSRRDFLRGLSAAALATLAAGEPRPLDAAENVTHPQPTADTCILLCIDGGRPRLSRLHTRCASRRRRGGGGRVSKGPPPGASGPARPPLSPPLFPPIPSPRCPRRRG